MFCSAVIGALQEGHAERGTIRLNGSRIAAGIVLAPESVATSSLHCWRHWRSSMIGRRWITTLRKLPTTRPNARQVPMNKDGEAASSASTDMLVVSRKASAARDARRLRVCFVQRGCLNHRRQLEDWQIHGDNEAADHHAEDQHDEWLKQARHRIDGVVDLCLVEGRHLSRHLIERARLFADRDHL